MKATCPACGAISSLEAFLNDADQRQCLRVVAEMPRDMARVAIGYVGLFRPPGGRGLQWRKVRRLLTELQDLAAVDTIQYNNGPARPCTPGILGMAMDRMIMRPPRRLPLKNHNYLRSVAYEIADDADRKAEVKRNEGERSGFARPDRGNMETAERLDFSEMQEITNARFRNRDRSGDGDG